MARYRRPYRRNDAGSSFGLVLGVAVAGVVLYGFYKLSDAVQAGESAIAQIPGEIGTGISNMASSAYNAVTGGVSSAVQGIENEASSAYDAATGAASSAYGTVSSALSSAGSWISDEASSLFGGGSGDGTQ